MYFTTVKTWKNTYIAVKNEGRSERRAQCTWGRGALAACGRRWTFRLDMSHSTEHCDFGGKPWKTKTNVYLKTKYRRHNKVVGYLLGGSDSGSTLRPS